MSRPEHVPETATPVPPPPLTGTAAPVGPAHAPPAAGDRAPAPAKKTPRRRVLVAAVVIAVVGGLGWAGWHWATVGRFQVATDDAYVRADTAVIAARATGHVVRVAVADQQAVKAGDLLVEIDSGDYALAVAAAESRIATQKATLDRIAAQVAAQRAVIGQAEASLVAARSDVDRTEADLVRAQDLVRTATGTQQRLDQARADRDRTRAAVAVAEAGVAAARGNLAVLEAQGREADRGLAELTVALDKAKRDLSFTRVVAPFDGVVGNRAAQPGQYVQPGTRLLALVPMATLYVEANFKETQIARLKPGQTVEVAVDAAGARPVEGRVVSLAPATGAQFSLLPPENATGNFTKIVQRVPVRIALPAEVIAEGLVRPGLSVEVTVDTREAK